MQRRGIIIVGAVIYLLTMFLVIRTGSHNTGGAIVTGQSPASTTSASAMPGLPYRSVGMQIQRVDWIDRYKDNIDKIAAIGADTVLLVVDSRQENSSSTSVYLDMRMTPTDEQLGELIRHAKEKKLRVIVMPIVLLDHPRGSSEWRGTINPAENEYDKTQGGWSGWFDSYRAMMGRFAMVAQLNNADVLVVGSELVSSEEHVDQWLRTIADVRGIFKGNLTYSANWDHYSSIQFWDRLDMIGMNSYWKLGEDRNVTVDQIQTRWQAIKRQLQEFQHTQGKGKPLLFLEAGWCSLANAASEPWDYTQTGAQVDTDLQKRLYQAFFETWYGDQSLGGFSIWEWTCNADERGYTPEAKPAYDVLRQWLAKPRWVVK